MFEGYLNDMAEQQLCYKLRTCLLACGPDKVSVKQEKLTSNTLCSRYLFAAGRYEQMPRICSMIHISYQTPVHAIVIAVRTSMNPKKRIMNKGLFTLCDCDFFITPNRFYGIQCKGLLGVIE